MAVASVAGVSRARGRASKPGSVLAETATRGALDIIAASSGTVEAEIRVDVKSRASGEVFEVTVQPGDSVANGDLLVRLDPADEERRVQEAEANAASVRSRLAKAEAQEASARANLLDAEGRWKRRTGAHAAGLISYEELEAAQTAFRVAEQGMLQQDAEIRSASADLERAELAIGEARKRLNETVIRAPVSGTVLSANVERGSIVSSGITNVGGGSTLLTLADLSKLFVTVKLDEANIGSVTAGQEVRIRVDAFPNRFFRGEVERVTPVGVAEANIVTFDVKVAIKDTDAARGALFPGMRTDVEIVTARHEEVLLIPSAAVRRDQASAASGARQKQSRDENSSGSVSKSDGRRKNYVILADGERREITIGATNGVQTIILEGLAEGDSVVVAGLGDDKDESKTGGSISFMGGRSRR